MAARSLPCALGTSYLGICSDNGAACGLHRQRLHNICSGRSCQADKFIAPAAQLVTCTCAKISCLQPRHAYTKSHMNHVAFFRTSTADAWSMTTALFVTALCAGACFPTMAQKFLALQRHLYSPASSIKGQQHLHESCDESF